jgi:dTDP-4-dehydrorhamnose reductase
VNAVAPGVLAEEARRLGALLVHYSSVYVFDGTKSTPYVETDTPNPINEYGRTKLLGEQAIAAAGGDHLILRASWVYDVRARNFVLTMLKLAQTRNALHVVDDQLGSPTWAHALALATCVLLRDVADAKAAAGIYNLAALGGVNRYDFTKCMLDLTRTLRPGRPNPRLTRIKTPDFPLPAARPLNSVLDSTRIIRAFDVPLQNWEAQLRGCLAELNPAAVRAA